MRRAVIGLPPSLGPSPSAASSTRALRAGKSTESEVESQQASVAGKVVHHHWIPACAPADRAQALDVVRQFSADILPECRVLGRLATNARLTLLPDAWSLGCVRNDRGAV